MPSALAIGIGITFNYILTLETFCLACDRPDLTASLTNYVPVMTLCMSEVFFSTYEMSH